MMAHIQSLSVNVLSYCITYMRQLPTVVCVTNIEAFGRSNLMSSNSGSDPGNKMLIGIGLVCVMLGSNMTPSPVASLYNQIGQFCLLITDCWQSADGLQQHMFILQLASKLASTNYAQRYPHQNDSSICFLSDSQWSF